jgi:hypothetical protein
MRFCFVLFIAMSQWACSSDVDGEPTGRPQILNVSFIALTGTDKNGLSFTLSFSDYDGNLGQGELSASVNNDVQPAIPLETVFGSQTPPLALDSNTGSFDFDIAYENASVDGGDKLDLEFILTDANSETSEPKTLTLVAVVRDGT